MIHRVPLLLTLVALSWAPAHADPWDDGMAAYRAGAYAEAVATWQTVEAAADPPVPRAEVRAWVGLALLKKGELDEAETWLRRAAATRDPRLRGVAERRLGLLAQRRRDLATAEAHYEAAAEASKAAGDAQGALIADLQRAGLAMQRGEPLLAHEAYGAALEHARALGDAEREAVALGAIGVLCRQLKQLDLARAYLAQVADLYREQSAGPRAAKNHIEQAFVEELAGDYPAAADFVDRAEALAGESVHTHRMIVLRRGFLALRQGDLVGARRHADALHAAQRSEPVPYVAADVALFDARLSLLEGDRTRAAQQLRAATEAAIQPLARMEVDFLRARWALAGGDEEAALAALQRFVATHDGYREGFADAALGDYLGHEYAEGLTALLGLRAVTEDPALASWVIARLKGRLFAERLLSEAGDAQPLPGRAGRTRRLDAAVRTFWRHTRATGDAAVDAVVLDYYVGERRTWIVWRAGAKRGVEVEPIGRAVLAAHARDLVTAIRGRRPDWAAAARPLADALLKPLRRARTEQPALDRLIVVPHGALHNVPFEALPLDDGSPVVAHYTVAYAANAATAPTEPLPPPASDRPSLWVADARGDLPGARAEVQSLSKNYARPTVLQGPAATRRAVLEGLADAGVAHLAVHGRPDDQGKPPRLLLAGEDRLTAADLLQLSLRAATVVLAACDSAVGTPDAADEMPTVLPRALLLAGAQVVIGTRWPIDDRSATRVMTRLHAGLRPLGPERALAEAQRALLASSEGDAMIALRNSPPCATNRGLRECVPGERVGFAHPFHWAGFALLGATTDPY